MNRRLLLPISAAPLPLLACLVFLLATGRATPADASPGRYVVFSLEGEDLEVVSHQKVDVSGFAEPLSPGSLPGGRREAVELTLVAANGTEKYRGSVVIPRSLRPEPAVFVARFPLTDGGELVFGPPLDLVLPVDALPKPEPTPMASSGQVVQGSATGPPENRVDLLILSDGFTEDEKADFLALAETVEESLFAVEPHDRYRDFVNVTALFLPSAESGADHPPYVPGCDDEPTCCGDPAASEDPQAGSFVDTVLDARFCARHLQRYLVVDEAKALTAAGAVPDWDEIFVVVNDLTLGASGDQISVTSANPSLRRIVPHEYGHTFTRLADEYESFFDWPPCSDVAGPPCEANVTDVTDPEKVKWRPWIDEETPIPTPEIFNPWEDVVGLFEGARYMPAGMFRPRLAACLMNSRNEPFCEICRQEYVLRLYRGGWGIPTGGIELIEPGSPSPSEATVVTNEPLTLSAELVRPDGDPPLTVTWRIDDEVVSEVQGPEMIFAPGAPGDYEIELTITDPTPFVHPEMEGGHLVSRHHWAVRYGQQGGCVTSATSLCLQANRFRAQIDWETAAGTSGRGRVVGGPSEDSGLFWFFHPDNWEVLVKVLDGCSLNDRFWVFLAATTDVGFTLTVTDTLTDEIRTYENPLGRAADAVTDTAAFDTCSGL